MGDPTYPLFPIFASLGFILALVPMPWHLQGWNAGICIYMVWASFASLIEFVDSVVWNGNISNPAPVWCDISTKFLIGAGVGIPASSLCINRRLYRISTMRSASITLQEKRRAIYEDIAIGVGIPALVMILHYVVQGHRFNVLEDVGCTPDIWNTPPAYPLVLIWPVLLGCVSFVYASLTLRSFWRRRAQFTELLASSSLTTSRYLRLMLLCCVEMAFTVPLGVFSICINNVVVPVVPYVSWANAHYNFSFVEKFPAVVWMSRRPFYISVEMGRWIYPCSAFLFFALFGFASEARRHYSLAFGVIVRALGFRHRPKKLLSLSAVQFGDFKQSSTKSDDTLPPYAPPTPVRRKRPASLSSSLANSVINIHVEKAAESPASTSTTLAHVDTPTFPEPALSCERKAYLKLRDRHSRSATVEPSNPPEESHELLSRPADVPPHYRPFAPPTICPMSASEALARCAACQITVHTETTQSV